MIRFSALRFFADRKMRAALKILDNFVFSMIEERRKDANLDAMDDLLSSYIKNTKEDDLYLRYKVPGF